MVMRTTYNLSIGVQGAGGLSVQGAGIQFNIDPHPIGEPHGPWPPDTYKCHAKVYTVTAPAQKVTPNYVASFSRWEGDVTSKSLEITITMDSNKTIMAVYWRSEGSGAETRPIQKPVIEPGPPTPPVDIK